MDSTQRKKTMELGVGVGVGVLRGGGLSCHLFLPFPPPPFIWYFPHFFIIDGRGRRAPLLRHYIDHVDVMEGCTNLILTRKHIN